MPSYLNSGNYSLKNNSSYQPSSSTSGKYTGDSSGGSMSSGMSIGGAFSELGSQIHEDVLEGWDFFSNLELQKRADRRAEKALRLQESQFGLNKNIAMQQMREEDEARKNKLAFARALGGNY